MLLRNVLQTSLALAALLSVVGCASKQRTSTVIDLRQLDLVVHSDPMNELAASPDDFESDAWTFSRNDDRLGATLIEREAALQYVEVRQRDFLRTINGRPREYSTTTTTSIKRGVTP